VKTKHGKQIVVDPSICHGSPTFRGTRILVQDVLEQVAMGLEWDSICEQWRGAITKDAIAAAVRFATEVLNNHVADLGAGDHRK
jgi:uncharacterized protein (DUF433 family)